jgi:DNA-binding transcriptional MerR regulator
MTLDEIRALLAFRDVPEESCSAVNALLDKHIEHVAHRIRELQSLQKQLKILRGRCQTTQTTKDCEILQSLASTDGSIPANLGKHGGGCH